ncbi:MAG: PAS domain S-box protein [Deltaproteobacteria bacterium]|nr:PAS domain S-box protein [Deltaproteobacteria bacterium]
MGALAGPALDQILGRALIELSHPDDRARFGAVAEELADGREVVGFELRLATADGGWRTVLWSASASAEEQLIYAIGRDITDRKQAEQLLEEKSRLVAPQAPVRKIMLFAERLRALYGDQLPSGAQVPHPHLRLLRAGSWPHRRPVELLPRRGEPITFQSVDLGVVVRQVLSDLEEVIHEKGGRS